MGDAGSQLLPHGVVAPILTPFEADGSVSHVRMVEHAHRMLANGCVGLAAFGTTGEALSVATRERTAALEALVEGGIDPGVLVVGTGITNLPGTVHLTRHAVDLGCRACMVLPPFYFKDPAEEGLYRHFTAIADETDLPLMIYNIPGRTARLIEIKTLVALSKHEGIVAVKDAVDNEEFSRNSLDALPEDFAVYSGSDSMNRTIISAGGVGAVSVASHLVGSQLKRLIDAVISGDDKEADRIEEALAPLCEALFVEPSPMPLKAAMGSMWGPVGDPRLPLVPAAQSTRDLLEKAMETAQLI